MRTLRGSLVVSVALLVCVAWAVGCGKKEAGGPGAKSNVIKIGVYGSLTGNDATFGQSTKAGVDLAIKDINGAGGVNGYTFESVVEDDEGKPDEAATVVDKLITQDDVPAVIGEVASSRSLAGGPKCQNAGVPMISPSSTNPKVTEIGDYVFRVCYLDPFQGHVMSRFVAENLHAKTVAILRDVKSDYSVGLAQFFSEAFAKTGGKVVSDQSYSSGDSDFKAQLTSIRATNPDVIFIPGYYTDVGLIARQARDLGIKSVLAGGDGWDSKDLVKVGGDKLLHSYFSTHYSIGDTAAVVHNFVTAYKATYNDIPDGNAALAFDATKVLVEAIKRVVEKDPKMLEALSTSGKADERKAADKALRDEIAATKDFVGVTGRISIGPDRNAVKPATIVEVTQTSLTEPGNWSVAAVMAP